MSKKAQGFYTDGVILNKFYHDDHDDTMHVKQTQPSEQLILDRNAELRRNKGALKPLAGTDGKAWGGMTASIPEIMYHKVCKEGKYDLNNDKDLNKWLKDTPEGRACLV